MNIEPQNDAERELDALIRNDKAFAEWVMNVMPKHPIVHKPASDFRIIAVAWLAFTAGRAYADSHD